MKRISTIALLVLLTAAACSQRPANTAATGNSTQVIAVTDSVLRFGASDTLRLGRLHSGEQAVRSFALRNDTPTPIVIINHSTTCNCTSFDYDRSPCMPGEQTVVRCTFDSRGEFGWQFKLVKMRLSGSDEPLRIFIEAEVE